MLGVVAARQRVASVGAGGGVGAGRPGREHHPSKPIYPTVMFKLCIWTLTDV